MRIRSIKSVVALGGVVALAVGVCPGAAQAAGGDNAPVPLSVVMARSGAAAVNTYRIANGNSGKYLQPSGGSTANGTIVVQQPTGSNSVQGWKFIDDNTYVTYENVKAGKNLGVDGASTTAGAKAIIANGSSSFDQDWAMERRSTFFFRLHNRKDANKCLGISGASTANGAVAAIFNCDDSKNQMWTLEGI